MKRTIVTTVIFDQMPARANHLCHTRYNAPTSPYQSQLPMNNKNNTTASSPSIMSTIANYTFLLGICLLSTVSLSANTITVDSTDATMGMTSLRTAVATATSGDTIVFDASIDGDTIFLITEISLDKNLILLGNDTTNTIIDGMDNSRIFHIPAGDTVSISGIKMQGGNGGGVQPIGGTNGGAIYNQGTLTLTNSTLSGNSVSFSGGGIFNFNFGTVTLTNSTVSGNSADLGGGLSNTGGTLKLTNGTVSGNSAAINGGGIYNVASGMLTLTNSTMSGNSAFLDGGGIYNAFAIATLTNSIVAKNNATSGSGPDIENDDIINDGGNNHVMSPGGGHGITDGNNVDPLFVMDVPSTATMPSTGGDLRLQCGSVAIDAGTPDTTGLNIGVIDILGNPRIAGTIDIGAYERPKVVTNTNDSGIGSLRDIIANACPGDTIRFASAIDGDTIKLTTEITLDKNLVIIGNDTTKTIIDGQATSRIFRIPAGDTVSITGIKMQGGNGGGVQPTFSQTAQSGGAVFNEGHLTIASSTIIGNTATGQGGGVLNNNSATVTFINSTISGNTSSSNGGGLSNRTMCTATFINTMISGNMANQSGGVANARTSTATFINSTISGNNATAQCGGVFNTTSTAIFTNSTISGNTSGSAPGGFFNINSSATFTNTIVAKNIGTTPDIWKLSGTITDGGNNHVMSAAGGHGITDGNGIDPLFVVVVPAAPSTGGDLRLQCGSPAIDAGSNTAATTAMVPATDINGNPRIITKTIDIGAYELQAADAPTPITFVTNTNDSGCGSLRFAVCNAMPGDTIRFAANLNMDTIKLITEIVIDTNLVIIGNDTTNIIIDGMNTSRIFYIPAGDTVSISGIKMQGGNGGGVQPFSVTIGGAIYNQGTLSLTNSTVSGNTAELGGGIFNISSGTLTLTNSTVSGNAATFATSFGGGIDNRGVLTMTNTTVSGNTANLQGGGISNRGSLTITNSAISGNTGSSSGGLVASGGGINNFGTVTLTNSTVSGNTAHSGGGIENSQGTVTLTNTTVSGNTATFGGGIEHSSSGMVTLTNSTVSGNSAPAGEGGGIYNSGPLTLTNSIIAKNTAPKGPDIYKFRANITDDGHNLIGDTTSVGSDFMISTLLGNTTMPLDPLFITDVDMTTLPNSTGDLRLRLCSPAVDAGLTSALPKDTFDIDMDLDSMEMLPLDLAGEDRVFGTAVDIGAYETQQLTTDPLVVMNTNDDGPQSLRYLVDIACPGDTITFDASLDNMPIMLTSGEITLDKNLTILGRDTTNTIIDGMGTSRIFHIPAGDTAVIDAVKLQHGNGEGTIFSNNGGAILNQGHLTLNDAFIIDNLVTVSGTSEASRGGGVLNGGILNVINSNISGNTATAAGSAFGSIGGGIYNDSTLTLTNSVIAGNSATISGNAFLSFGGGVMNNDVATADFINSTISGNIAVVGGGVGNDVNCTVTMTNTTMAGNSATISGGGFINSGSLMLLNSIVAQNDAPVAPDINNDSNSSTTIIDGGHNLIGDTTSVGSDFLISTLLGNSAMPLDPLFLMDVDTMNLPNMGGDLRLQCGSPAIDAGKQDTMGLNIGAVDLDSLNRVVDTIDIGAYEFQFDNMPTSTQDSTICENDLPLTWGGVTFTMAGTLMETIANSNGCDSVITYNLTVNENTSSTQDSTICENDLPLAWGNVTFMMAGTLMDTIANSNGCDSMITYNLTVNENTSSTQDSTICENDLPLTWGNVTFMMAGTLMDTIANANGCDSVITYNLTVNENTSSTQDSTICENDLPLTWGNVTFMMAGTLMDTIANANGCDSVITYNLTVNENTSSTQDSTICENDLPLTWGNVTFMMAGTLMDTIANANGCDSVITYNLTVNENTSSTQDSTICENDLPLTWGNVTFMMAGTLMDTIANANGCDSVITYNLTVNENTSSTQDSTICENDLPLTWGNVTFMMAGTLMDTIANANGCDSLITYNLMVNENTSSTQDSTICENDLPLNWGNVTFMMAGTLMDTIANANTCDSVITYNLTVNENTSSTQDSTICENDLPLTWGNVTFMMAGTLMDTIPNANGCDSLITYNLTVNELTTAPSIIGPTMVCQNLSDITYEIVSPDPAVTYTWEIVSGSDVTIVGSGSLISLDFGPAATDIVLQVSAEGICDSPTATMSITIGSPEFCELASCLRENIHIDDELLSLTTAIQVYKAEIAITSNAIVNQPLIFKAGKSIELFPAFEVAQGALFIAQIEACQE